MNTAQLTPAPDLNAFAKECHEISDSKGWIALKRTDAQLANLMVSELSEALEEFRNKRGLAETYYECKFSDGNVDPVAAENLPKALDAGNIVDAKPCGIPTELADLIIRVAQDAGTKCLPLTGGLTVQVHKDFNDMLAYVTEAVITARNTDEEKKSLSYSRAIGVVEAFCFGNQIDIWAAVKEKNDYNKTRPALHGGKAI